MQIIIPAIALGFWTFCVLLMIPITRFWAVGHKSATAKDFKLGETDRIPNYVKLPNRNYMNLTELPTLFYFITIVIQIAGVTSNLLIMLSWIYVGMRIAHSIVHIFFNNVILRFLVFAIGNVVLLAIWGITASKLLFHAG